MESYAESEENGNVLILLTPILSRLWLCLLLKFFILSHKCSYDSSENQPLPWSQTTGIIEQHAPEFYKLADALI